MSSPTGQSNPESLRGLPNETREWLDQHPDAKAGELEEVWRFAETASPIGAGYEPDADRVTAMRATIMDRIAAESQPPTPSVRKVWTNPRIWAVAASVLVTAAIGMLVLRSSVSVTAPTARLERLSLSDGSQVTLSSGSTLTYPRGFGWFGRSVDLRGEAFFDVAKGADTFRVKTFNGIVTVLGTRFDVRAWPEDMAMETSVILAEGALRLTAKNARDGSVELHTGQMSRIVGSSTPPTQPVNVNVDRLLVWMNGGLAYSETEMGVVLADLARRFDVKIVASNEIRRQQVSLYMSHADSVEAVLDVLASMHHLKSSHEGNRYELRAINE